MGATAVDDRSDRERFAAITERIATLRERNEALLARAATTAEHVRSLREAPRAACNHAQQVAEMRQMLDGVERELDGLRVAMQTRGAIEQAKGMLMLQRQCDADEAFQTLVTLSQTSHRKLVEVAQTLVASWTAGHAPT